MKTPNPTSNCRAASASIPLEIPTSTGPRPVRRGNFWPGESFNTYTRNWNLSRALGDQAFVLPRLVSGSGSRTL
jgi:hypothetical protein